MVQRRLAAAFRLRSVVDTGLGGAEGGCGHGVYKARLSRAQERARHRTGTLRHQDGPRATRQRSSVGSLVHNVK